MGCSAGYGAFGAVGFLYGGGGPTEAVAASAASESETDSDDSDDTEEGSEGEEGGGGGVDVDVAAAAFGVDNFAVMLRRAEHEEEAIASGKVPKRK